MDTVNALGRRKTAVARAYVTSGKGKVTINNKDVAEYFNTPVLLEKVNRPFQLTETEKKFDVVVNATGGGINGQAEAVSLALCRALVKIDEENKTLLKAEGLMTRDPRMVERKKPGQKKARKKFQFSKR
jgi:small subunit ribosomal protein S9